MWKYYLELLNLKGKSQDTKDTILKALQEGWEAIEEFFEKLIKNIHKSVHAVCKAKG
jgi:hypothetical protein